MAETHIGESVDVARNFFFTDIKDKWWDLNGDVKLLHMMNSRSLEYVKEVFRKRNLIIDSEGFQLQKDLKILDVGCGGGILTEPLARTGANICGIDINQSMIDIAQKHAKLDPCLKNISYRWESIEDHSVHNLEKYDIVILNFVLHYSINHETLLKGCIRALKPGGIFIVSSISKTYEAWIRTIIMGETIFGYIPPKTFNWNYFINWSDLQQILKDNHCDVDDVKGLVYDIFSSSVKWTDNTNAFYILHSIKHKNTIVKSMS